jgi:hypothetical protein
MAWWSRFIASFSEARQQLRGLSEKSPRLPEVRRVLPDPRGSRPILPEACRSLPELPTTHLLPSREQFDLRRDELRAQRAADLERARRQLRG